MRRLLYAVYGSIAFLLFVGTWAYFVGFLAGIGVPRSIDSGPATGRLTAMAWNVGLLAIFFTHHSLMARAGAKRLLTKALSPVIERATYVLVASLALDLMLWQWHPLPGIAWRAQGLGRLVLLAGFWTGVIVALVAAFTIDGFDLFGLRQVLIHFRGRTPKHTATFATPGLYRLVRHPLMTGILLSLWSFPIMSQGRLLLATTMSAYIYLAVKLLEERDLKKTFGGEYERYQREVPMVVPFKGVSRKSPGLRHEDQRLVRE